MVSFPSLFFFNVSIMTNPSASPSSYLSIYFLAACLLLLFVESPHRPTSPSAYPLSNLSDCLAVSYVCSTSFETASFQWCVSRGIRLRLHSRRNLWRDRRWACAFPSVLWRSVWRLVRAVSDRRRHRHGARRGCKQGGSVDGQYDTVVGRAKSADLANDLGHPERCGAGAQSGMSELPIE